MPDKYIRISKYLHDILKVKSTMSHMSMKDLAESYIWEIVRRDNKVKPLNKSIQAFIHDKGPTGQNKK